MVSGISIPYVTDSFRLHYIIIIYVSTDVSRNLWGDKQNVETTSTERNKYVYMRFELKYK